LNVPLEHLTALEKIEEVGLREWKKRLTFSVIRNPWDRVVSQYHWRIHRNHKGMADEHIEFKEWVLKVYRNNDPYYYDQPRMFMPQIDWIADKEGEVLVDELLRFESLNAEFEVIRKRLGKKAALPHLKRSEHHDYRNYYDSETIEIVREWFQMDIQLLGFKYDQESD
jgi:chondroitin 4-sulfotransferase 11